MRRPVFKFLACAVAGLFGAGFARAQVVTPSPSPTTTPTTIATPPPTRTPGALNQPSARGEVDRARAKDAAFMARAQRRGLEETELGRLAATRASNTEVRSLGQQILLDRGKLNDELQRFAGSQSVDLPTALEPARRAEVDRVSRLSGPDLDRAIMAALLRTHDADVADFEQQTGAGQEVELQGWVSDTLPLLQGLQERIHGAASKLNP